MFRNLTYKYLSWYFSITSAINALPLKFTRRRWSHTSSSVRSGSFEVITGQANFILTHLHIGWSILYIVSTTYAGILRIVTTGKLTSLVIDCIWLSVYILITIFQIFLSQNKQLLVNLWNQIIHFDDYFTHKANFRGTKYENGGDKVSMIILYCFVTCTQTMINCTVSFLNNKHQPRYPWALIKMGVGLLGFELPGFFVYFYAVWESYQYYVLSTVIHVYLFPILMYANCTNYWMKALAKQNENSKTDNRYIKPSSMKSDKSIKSIKNKPRSPIGSPCKKKSLLDVVVKRINQMTTLSLDGDNMTATEKKTSLPSLRMATILETDRAIRIYKMMQILNKAFNSFFSRVFFPMFKVVNVGNQCFSLFMVVKYNNTLPPIALFSFAMDFLFWLIVEFALYSPCAQVILNSEKFCTSWKTGYGPASRRHFRPLRPLSCKVGSAYNIVRQTILTLLNLVTTVAVNLILTF